MVDRWHLSDEKKKQVTAMITGFIETLTSLEITDEFYTQCDIDFSDLAGIGPYHVKEILESLGYEEESFSDNGWQMDYWFHFIHPEPDRFPPLCLSGTAIIHEMILSGEQEDYGETYKEWEDKEYEKSISNTVNLLEENE